MNHSLLAGGFCTLATIALFIEMLAAKEPKLNTIFFLFYTFGCFLWVLLGVVTKQTALFMIGMVQVLALISSYWALRIKGNYETS